jgi:hypothetical protein
VGELMSALDALAAEDLFVLTGRQNLDRNTMISVAINRLQAEFARSDGTEILVPLRL